MNHSPTMLGRYAILQHRIWLQLAEHRHLAPSRPSLSSDRSGSREFFATETEKLTSLVEGSHDNLFMAKTVFPFVLFADTLKIDRQKLTIVHNDFLWKSQTTSTEIKNIMNIETDLGPLFGSITITSKHFLNNTQAIKYLKRSDVTKAQRLLQGFMIAQRAEINTDDIDKKQLLNLLNDLGQENRR